MTQFFNLFIYFNWRLIALWYCGGLCHVSTWISHRCTCVPPSWNPLPPPYPPYPSTLFQCTDFRYPASFIEFILLIYFTYGNIHVSVLFSHIVPPSPSPTESKYLFFTSVSHLLTCIWGHRYCLSKFPIYAVVYCIGVFLSDLLHSV